MGCISQDTYFLYDKVSQMCVTSGEKVDCYPITAWMDVLLTLYVIAQTWGVLISTEGAHIRPMTYDNHPIHPNSHIALKTTSLELR